MHGYDPKKVIEVVRRARRQRCLSCARLAELSGLSTKTIHRIEKSGFCHAATLASVAEVVGIELSDFKSDIRHEGSSSASPFVIAVMNFKGGVAKTTLCLHLAGVLAKSGKSVLVLDFVGQLHELLAERPPELPAITSFRASDTCFRKSWPVRTEFDCILIDCNTSDYAYCASVVHQADVLIVPTPQAYMELEATYLAIEAFQRVAPQKLVILPVLVMERKRIRGSSDTRKLIDDIEQKLGCPFASSRISYKQFFSYLGVSIPGWNEKIAKPKYTVSGKTIADIDDLHCKAAVAEFNGLLAEVFELSKCGDRTHNGFHLIQ